MITVEELWGATECGVCGEQLKLTDVDIAEMVDGEGNHHIVHYMCGQGKEMELA